MTVWHSWKGKTPLDIVSSTLESFWDIFTEDDDEEECEAEEARWKATKALLEELMFTGADERPGEMIKSATKRFKPMDGDH